MELVTNTFERNMEMDDVDNGNTWVASKPNLPVSDALSTIGHASRNAGIYLKNVFNLARDQLFWVSKETLYGAFLTRASENMVQVSLHPARQGSMCDSKRLIPLKCATALNNCTIIQPCSPVCQSDNSTVSNELPLGAIMASSEINGTIDAALSVSVPCDNEPPIQIDNSHMQGSKLIVHSSLQIIDPTPFLLIQRRLKSVTAMPANDMIEVKCIHYATLLVQDGYIQLAQTMKQVNRLIGDLSPSAGLSAMKSETTASNVVEVHNQGATLVEFPNTIGFASSSDILREDVCFCEGLSQSSRDLEEWFSVGPFPEHDLHENFDFVLKEEKRMYNKDECDKSLSSPPFFLDQRKSTIISPSDALYTYRSDDSWQKERFDSYASCDSENQMFFVFTSPPTESSATNEEEIRSLLSQSIILSRRHAYKYRRPRRLVPYGKSILPRLVCMR